MNPGQSDLGLYCLQYRLSKNTSRREERTTKVLTCGLRVKNNGLNAKFWFSFHFLKETLRILPL